MNIGVDVRELASKKAGIGWYVFHVLKNILELDTKNNYTLYSDAEIDFPEFNNATVRIISRNGLSWHYATAKEILKDKIDLYWAPSSPIIPAITSVPTVMTIHDMTTFLFPAKHELKGRIINKLYLKRALSKTQKIITISNSTKRDIKRLFKVPGDLIFIVYPGYDSKLFKVLSDSEIKTILDKHKLFKPYILCVATLEPRKNHKGLINAFNLLPDNIKNKYDLALVGKKGWFYDEIYEVVNQLNLKDKVKFLGYVNQSDMPAIYNGAELFAYPSLYEGFGLPPLDAMACGKAVITSNVSSLPEVVGDAAVLIDPNDTKAISKAMSDLIGNPKAIQELENKSISQAKKFSWEKCASQTLDAFLSVGRNE